MNPATSRERGWVAESNNVYCSVTGTSTGIGFATAVTLGRAGHTVVVTMRNLKSGAELQRIASEEKLPIAVATLDVDDDLSVSDAFDKVLTEYGRIVATTV